MAPFVHTLPVAFADVDYAGIVYYPRYFHYFHLTMEALWRARSGPAAYVRLLDEERLGLPSVKASCEYRSPLRFGDLAEIELRVVRRGTTSLTFSYLVYRAGEPRVLAAEGEVVCAVLDLTRFVAVPPPASVRAVFDGLDEPPATPA